GRSAASSFAMMSLHRATHSSQMKTRGPEMSFRTSRRLFPQKEQWKSSITHHYYTAAPERPIADRKARLLNGNRAVRRHERVLADDGLIASRVGLVGEAPVADVLVLPTGPEGHDAVVEIAKGRVAR